jgi:hypothetical protein
MWEYFIEHLVVEREKAPMAMLHKQWRERVRVGKS